MAISQINSNSLASGVPATSNLPVGTVLQVVNGTLAGNVTTTSTSFVTTGLSATITPTKSTSKILAFVSGSGYVTVSNAQNTLTLYRNATNLNINMVQYIYSSAGGSQVQSPVNFNYLDSPASTSSITYTVYFRNTGSGQIEFNSAPNNAGIATLTLMEISA
jgi:hypothetical protein